MALSVFDTENSAGRSGLSRAARARDGGTETFSVDRTTDRSDRDPAPRPATRPAMSDPRRPGDRSRPSDLTPGKVAKEPGRPSATSAEGRSATSDLAPKTRQGVGPRDAAPPAASRQIPANRGSAADATGAPQAGTDPSATVEAQAAASAVEAQATKTAAASDEAETEIAGDGAPPVPGLPLLTPAPPPPTGPQAAAPPLPSSGAASAPQPGGSALASAGEAGAKGQALVSAETRLAAHASARAGHGDAPEGGDGAGAKAEGNFAAAFAPALDASVPPAPSTAPAAGADAAAAAPPATQAPAQAPVPLGAVPMTIGLRSLAGANQFEIRLDPKDLGRIDVNLAIDKDTGTVQATLVVDRPETLALLQRDAGNLQQALSQAGLDAPDGSITVSLRSDGQASDGNASDSSGSGGHQPGGDGRPRRETSAETPLAPSPVALRLYGGGRGLDIRI